MKKNIVDTKDGNRSVNESIPEKLNRSVHNGKTEEPAVEKPNGKNRRNIQANSVISNSMNKNIGLNLAIKSSMRVPEQWIINDKSVRESRCYIVLSSCHLFD